MNVNSSFKDFEPIVVDDFISRFKSDKNIFSITNCILIDLEVTNTEAITQIRKEVELYINRWINLGKFNMFSNENKIVGSLNIINVIEYYNNEFIKVFKYDFIKKYNYQADPFHDTINGKSRHLLSPEEYGSLNVQHTRVLPTRASPQVSRGTIPYYERALYNKHIDRNSDSMLTTHGNDRCNLLYSNVHTFDKELAELEDRTSNSESGYERVMNHHKKIQQNDLNILK